MVRIGSRLSNKSHGFTIIELMLALTVFSVILVAASAGLIQIGRMYYKSVITVRTQDTSRNIINELSRSIQFSKDKPEIIRVDPNNPNSQALALCVGTKRFTPLLNQQVTDDSTAVALYRDTGPNECEPATSFSDGVELVGQNMRLTRFDVTPLDDKNIQYRLTVWVAYGDDEVLEIDPNNPNRFICTGSEVGSEFCAISELSTVVSRRLL